MLASVLFDTTAVTINILVTLCTFCGDYLPPSKNTLLLPQSLSRRLNTPASMPSKAESLVW